MSNLLTDVRHVRCFGHQAAGTTDITTAATVDMGADDGYDSVLFVVQFGAMVNLSVVNLTIRHGDSTDPSQASVATTGNVTSDGTDNTVLMLEVTKPRHRYLKPVLPIATQNAVIDSIIAYQYDSRKRPTTQAATVLSKLVFASPADAS
jgi:hypothetical protein